MNVAVRCHTMGAPLALPVDAEPILVRDPFLEFLGLVPAGEPIAVTLEEMVRAAGHLCPTIAGAYLILRRALEALYGDLPAIRGEVRVTAYGGPEDLGYGPMSQVINLVVGAAPETGFGGMGRGYFHRRNLFVFRRGDLRRNAFDFRRLDTGAAVHITYNPAPIPAARALGDLLGPALAAGDAAAAEQFRRLWLARVRDILAAGDRVISIRPGTGTDESPS